MNEAERNLAGDRATRNAARGVFETHLARLRGDVEAHGGIVGKAKDEAGKRLLDAGKQGLAIAGESKGIIAGTLAALGLWFFRKPLIDAAKAQFTRLQQPDDIQEDIANMSATAEETNQ
jgi:hypothetical protein